MTPALVQDKVLVHHHSAGSLYRREKKKSKNKYLPRQMNEAAARALDEGEGHVGIMIDASSSSSLLTRGSSVPSTPFLPFFLKRLFGASPKERKGWAKDQPEKSGEEATTSKKTLLTLNDTLFYIIHARRGRGREKRRKTIF